jgi:hypothetical protein
MANVIRIKRRTSGAAGAPASLKSGELAYNNVDNTVYAGFGDDGSGNATSVKPVGGEGSFTLSTRNINTAANSGLGGGGDLTVDRSLTLDINNLTSTTSAADSDFLAIYDGSTTKKISKSNFVSALGGGSVTSVAVSAPSFLNVSGSPITTSGTINLTLANQTANQVFAGPSTGSPAAPDFRALVAGDIPTLTAAKISDFDTQVRTSRLDQMAAPTADVSLGGYKLTNLASPVSDTDAANKAYVDAARSGLDVKASVRVATTDNITLSGTQTIDGVAVIAGNRVLVKDQSTASQNGIYVVAAGAWTRASDFDADDEVTAGAFTFVEEGTANSDSGWVLTTNNPITVGTTALVFAQFSGAGQIIAGDGLTKSGNTLNVGGTANRITVTADAVDIALTYVGQTSITTLGTVGTGVWQGTAVAVAYGGTGASTFTSNGIIYGSGSSPLGVTAAGTWDSTNGVGTILSVNASGVPTWTNTIDGGSF